MSESHELLRRVSTGDESARVELYALVYSDLHERAKQMMRHQSPDHTLQPTALVHEAWLRLAKHGDGNWEDRVHFFKTASCAMQSVLVDHARAKLAEKRGGGRRIEGGTIEPEASDPSWRMLALNEALERMQTTTPDQHTVAQMRIFGGLPNGEIAQLTGTPLRTVERLWSAAREELRDAL